MSLKSELCLGIDQDEDEADDDAVTDSERRGRHEGLVAMLVHPRVACGGPIPT